ncbi:sugar kinase [Niabella ginsenosidivorans]|uniref:Sugar kinase n=1 Tax=Niabella ginsenosidivorans TaxID=1176587 RepID=A0A1A9HYP4_9BACT|nr:ROK family protein [Niabella ginsenosidivorans]ANH80506.1 sugar kinase [Niabella ginsenosidivorans]
MYAIAIDVGSTFIKCGLINVKGEIVYTFKMPSRDILTEGEIIALINAAVRKCASQAEKQVLGIGIGFPGIVENNIIVGGADNLPGFRNVNLGAIVAASTGLNVIVDNDANMMAWGEMQYGSGKNCSDVVFLTVGTGIGGCLVINNKLYGGFRNTGAELGHIVINFNGPECSCGGRGCFEAYASVKALIRDYAALTGISPADLNRKLLIKNYLLGEEAAITAMKQHFNYMSVGIASLVNIFSPQKVIIGGGIAEAGDFYVPEITRRVLQKAMPDTSSHTVIVRAQTGDNACLLGCASRVFSTPVLFQSNYTRK